jgi:hypothetical protein
MNPSEGLGSTDGTSTALVSALRRILRPLLRLLLAHRLTFPFFSALLKEMYVEVALAKLAAEGRLTDSRVSLMTGVHRKDVRRLRGQLPLEDSVPATVSRGAQLAHRWISSPSYQDAAGRPLALPRTAHRNGEPSFNQLVESWSTDVRPRSVLDELLDLGVATLDSEGRVCLRVEGFVPEKGFDEKAFYFGRSVRDHMDAAAHNLLGERPPLFERSVYYEGLSQASANEIEELSQKLGMDLLRAVNRAGASLKRGDAGIAKSESHRITLGVYFFRALKEGGDGPDKS